MDILMKEYECPSSRHQMTVLDIEHLIFMKRISAGTAISLPLYREADGFHWNDTYGTRFINREGECVMWKKNLPKNDDNFSAIKKLPCTDCDITFSTIGSRGEDAAVRGCAILQIKLLQGYYVVSNSEWIGRNLIVRLVEKQPKMDHKLIYAVENCYEDVHFTFPEGTVSLVFRKFE
ncbi:hypothetical protein SNEBB_001039 [Seison nebaliae]|nr:hypothetical protein SNEBB_001039 [Seison nebaliae]